MFNKLIVAATALLASTMVVDATMAPSYPSPGTVWNTGQQYTITWADDGTAPSIASGWKNFKIDFMTGDNDNQTFLTNVASNLDGATLTSFTWTAPSVSPQSAIYFFMFSNNAGQMAWTTRFGITNDGKLVAPQFASQPNGAKIPWGNGQLASAVSNTTASASASSAPSSSVAPSAASSAASSGAAASASSSTTTKANSAGITRPLTAGVAIAAVAAGLLI
ncbi:hypothetical protein DM01DRAFT_1381602 [Hesseltinella vesiculosa]|uniref:Yeast cell wall synthesis Kre9/Knh1-like N-terminal domain-containing protein n=1 Tax=Hesseltinella vesiculosa TaxID=101127 RepID=A0A1X2GQG2_9FUNG|nr:hypothetical protein DM01DRAFT_1381602 [Hesseltinella vesiculosa]